MAQIPVIDVGPLVARSSDSEEVGRAIDEACRTHGFFSVVGHGIDAGLMARVQAEALAFFALDEADKDDIAMARGGRAWRGWFPVGGELTSGVADRKEGLYFGAELGRDDPRVRAGLALHGPNLFPVQPAGLRPVVLATIDAFTTLGQRLMAGVALGLGLDEGFFERGLTAEPVVLFRIFHYPPGPPGDEATGWGVGEHTDYGLLTMLVQDATGGLEVRDLAGAGWLPVPPDPGAIVCNIGDMLERMTGGRYRSTPHRVRSPRGGDGRISLPFFFDPSWDARVHALPIPGQTASRDDHEPRDDHRRWDGADVAAFKGTYGEYLTAKVAKVFPALHDEVVAGS